MSKGMRPEDVPEDLMAVAIQAMYEQIKVDHSGRPDPLWIEIARHVAAAVLPLHEQQVRERIAADLDSGIRDLEQRADQAEDLTSRTVLLVQVEACKSLVATTSKLRKGAARPETSRP